MFWRKKTLPSPEQQIVEQQRRENEERDRSRQQQQWADYVASIEEMLLHERTAAQFVATLNQRFHEAAAADDIDQMQHIELQLRNYDGHYATHRGQPWMADLTRRHWDPRTIAAAEERFGRYDEIEHLKGQRELHEQQAENLRRRLTAWERVAPDYFDWYKNMPDEIQRHLIEVDYYTSALTARGA